MGLDWSPPISVDILRNVHVNRKTHIKKPFHHQQFPYQYKTEHYYTYNSIPQKKNEKVLDEGEEIEVELDSIRPEPKEQITKTSTIKQRIYNHQLYLFDDFVEYNIARDYCKLFNRPFNIPRQDWASPYHFFHQSIPLTQDDSDDSNDTDNTVTRADTIKPTNNTTTELVKLIDEINYVDNVKREELLTGTIPPLFDRSGLIKMKQKKDCWISYHNLKNYALMIDSVTKCPLLRVQSHSVLQRGWNTIQPTEQTIHRVPEEEKDPYSVSPDVLLRINDILTRRKELEDVEEEIPDITKLFKSKSYGINENCYTIGGGRYHI